MNSKYLQVLGNQLGLVALTLLFIVGFYVQIVMHHLPCPLCLLQRVAFAGVGIAIIFNLTLGIRAKHYGLMLLSAIFGLGTSIRHILLHILPNDPGFGFPIWGLHIYTWSAILFSVILTLGSFALMLDDGFHQPKEQSKMTKVIIWAFFMMIAANAISSLLECGLGECPADPEQYLLLS